MGPEENEGDEIYENAALEERVNKSVASEDEANEDVQASDFLVGANIKLLFSRSNQLEDTTSIWLIQFKKSINKDKGSTEKNGPLMPVMGTFFRTLSEATTTRPDILTMSMKLK